MYFGTKGFRLNAQAGYVDLSRSANFSEALSFLMHEMRALSGESNAKVYFKIKCVIYREKKDLCPDPSL